MTMVVCIHVHVYAHGCSHTHTQNFKMFLFCQLGGFFDKYIVVFENGLIKQAELFCPLFNTLFSDSSVDCNINVSCGSRGRGKAIAVW